MCTLCIAEHPSCPSWLGVQVACKPVLSHYGWHVLIHFLLLFCDDLYKAALSVAAPRGSATPQPAALACDSFRPRQLLTLQLPASPLLGPTATSPSHLQPVLCSVSHSASLCSCQSHINCSTRCCWALGFVSVCMKERVTSRSLDATDSAAVTTAFKLSLSSGFG